MGAVDEVRAQVQVAADLLRRALDDPNQFDLQYAAEDVLRRLDIVLEER